MIGRGESQRARPLGSVGLKKWRCRQGDEKLEMFKFVECGFGVFGCGLHDLERNVSIHSRFERVQ